MRCGTCNYAQVKMTTTTIEEWDGNELVVIEDVPVERCPQCGEEYFAPQVLRELESLMAQRRFSTSLQPAAILQVPVFKYAMAA